MIYGSFLIMGIGQLLITAANPVDQAFAARIGEGAVATLGYANRIVVLFMGLATVIVGRALLPVLSEAVADGNFDLGRRQATQWAVLLLVFSTIGALLLWIVAPVLIELVFERGAFGARATHEGASILRFGTLQLPLYFGGIALVQWYAATGRFSELFALNVIALVVKVACNLLLVPMLGLSGIMISTAVMYLATTGLMLLLMGRVGPAKGRGSTNV
jgi:peptidoglycan biosynthesis protein MviN/MurJ (putative lipid II flippase)